MKWGSNSFAILVSYDPARLENTYHASIAVFLKKIGLPVPRILRHDTGSCLILTEDLGDTDLWSLRDSPWELRRTLYTKTLSAIRKLHDYPEAAFLLENVNVMDGFGPELYRWERDYFREHFVAGVCRIELDRRSAADLESELSVLAERLSKGKTSLVHRDLQSQNIMVLRGEPYFIDFQGMRLGNRFYDLGSLLCDPYVDVSERERRELLQFHHDLASGGLGWADFQRAFWDASAQRLMQALGAYGFLGRSKGMESFLKHIPRAVQTLNLATGQVGTLPLLGTLLQRCQRAMGGKIPA